MNPLINTSTNSCYFLFLSRKRILFLLWRRVDEWIWNYFFLVYPLALIQPGTDWNGFHSFNQIFIKETHFYLKKVDSPSDQRHPKEHNHRSDWRNMAWRSQAPASSLQPDRHCEPCPPNPHVPGASLETGTPPAQDSAHLSHRGWQSTQAYSRCLK